MDAIKNLTITPELQKRIVDTAHELDEINQELSSQLGTQIYANKHWKRVRWVAVFLALIVEKYS